MKYVLIFVAFMLGGCVAPNILPPIVGEVQSRVEMSIHGLEPHTMYPDDVAWMNIYDGDIEEDEQSISQYRFTLDAPKTLFPIDSDRIYTYKIHTVESHFGGYSSCAVAFKLKHKPNARYSVTFSTQKTSCSAQLKGYDESGIVFLEDSIQGFRNGGIQFKASSY